MKKFVSGLIIGMLLMTSVFASESVQAMFTHFNFVINGQSVELETRPLLYQGTSYLPVREISNLVGYDVDFKVATNTIELKRKPDTPDLTSEGWYHIRDLVDVYNLQIFAGEDILIIGNDIELTFKSNLRGDGIEIVNSNHGKLSYRILNSRAYLRIDELKSIGLID